jgi:hypothetical protein
MAQLFINCIAKSEKCNPCVRYEMSPMSRAAQSTSAPTRAQEPERALAKRRTGERIGQPLSRESLILGADAVHELEGNMSGRDSASARTTRRGQRPWHVQTLLAREPGGLVIDRSVEAAGPHREGEEP